MKIEQLSDKIGKNVRIVVMRTNHLPNDIHFDGKIRIDRICGDYFEKEYKGQVGKVIAIEPLNDEFCAVMLAIEDNEAGLENIGCEASAEELEEATKKTLTKTI